MQSFLTITLLLAPYTTNSVASEVLGAHINISGNSDIDLLDSIALLVTLRGDQATGLYEIARGNVDFAHLGGECYPRDNALFSVPATGHPLATPVR